MFNYSKKTLYICAVLVAIIIFITIEIVSIAVDNSNKTIDNTTLYKIEVKSTDNANEIINKKTKIDENIWELEITTWGLKAPIKEGTGSEVLEKYIGHFEDTPKLNGNVCLASHNRGSVTGDYFECLEYIETGELITYRANGEERIYKVILSTIINEIDLSYIQNTNDNRLTLITCITNKPSLRRCVQAVLI